MELEGNNVGVTEQASPAIETTKTNLVETPEEQPVSLDETEDAESSEQGEDAEQGGEAAEYAEIEINGKKYQVPAELKDGYMMQAAFTQKTQAVAEERKQVETMRAEAQQMVQVSQDELNVRAQFLGISEQLQKYENVDWQELLHDDPMGFQEHRLNYETLQRDGWQAGQYLQSASQMRSANAQQEFAMRVQETRDFAENNIKGWTPETDEQMLDFAVNTLGADLEIIKRNLDPVLYQGLYYAMQGAKMLGNAAKKGAIPLASKPNPQPLSRVSSKSNAPANNDPARMTMDQYAAWRKANP